MSRRKERLLEEVDVLLNEKEDEYNSAIDAFNYYDESDDEEQTRDALRDQVNQGHGGDLYALQVFVEEVECPNNVTSVGFRLMDFPTIIVESDKAGNFQSGKSCLFRVAASEIRRQLRAAPLYLMLLDVTTQKQTLVGTTTLDLSGLCGLDEDTIQLLLPLISSGWGWRVGSFPFYDLMGNRVGSARVRVRLCGFGDGLIPHIIEREGDPSEDDDDIKRLSEEEVERFINNGIGLPSLEGKLPYPVEILDVMTRVEEKVDKIAQGPNAGIAMWTDKTAKTREIPQGYTEAAFLPPAMYFKNEEREGDAGPIGALLTPDQLKHEQNLNINSLTGGMPIFEALIKELVHHDKSLADRLLAIINQSSNLTVEDLPPPPPPPPSKEFSTPASKRSRRRSRLYERPVRADSKEDQTPSPPPPPSSERPFVLRIRSTRTQRLRENANQRKYVSPSPEARLGELAGSAARGKTRHEAILKPIILPEKINITPVESPDSETERVTRSKQLETLWKGQYREPSRKTHGGSRHNRQSGASAESAAAWHGEHFDETPESFFIAPIPVDSSIAEGLDSSLSQGRYHDFENAMWDGFESAAVLAE